MNGTDRHIYPIYLITVAFSDFLRQRKTFKHEKHSDIEMIHTFGSESVHKDVKCFVSFSLS